MKIRAGRQGYMLIVVLVFGIVMTALGAVLLYPTQREISHASSMEGRAMAREAVRSAYELALDELDDGREGKGQAGHTRFQYSVEAAGDGRFRIRASALAPAGNYQEEALLEAVVRNSGENAGRPAIEAWRITHRRAR